MRGLLAISLRLAAAVLGGVSHVLTSVSGPLARAAHWCLDASNSLTAPRAPGDRS